MSKPSVVLWGIGNPLFGDDAAGTVFADMLKNKEPEWLKVFKCETVPENYVAPLRMLSPEVLLIVDAADLGKRPGVMKRMTLKDFSNISFSTHGISLDLMLEGIDSRVIIIGIQPLTRELAFEEISEPVRSALEELEDIIISRSWDRIEDLHHEKRSPR